MNATVVLPPHNVPPVPDDLPIAFDAPANDAALIPFADISYSLERRRALSAQWVNDAAMQARLQKIEGDHQHLIRLLKANEPMDLPHRGDEP